MPGQLRLVRPVLTLDFSKPLAESEAAGNAALPFTADVRNIEIEDGRISVFSRSGGLAEALALTGDKRHRFRRPRPATPSVSTGASRRTAAAYDVKLLASPHAGALRLDGTATAAASKTSLHADGCCNGRATPISRGLWR